MLRLKVHLTPTTTLISLLSPLLWTRALLTRRTASARTCVRVFFRKSPQEVSVIFRVFSRVKIASPCSSTRVVLFLDAEAWTRNSSGSLKLFPHGRGVRNGSPVLEPFRESLPVLLGCQKSGTASLFLEFWHFSRTHTSTCTFS